MEGDASAQLAAAADHESGFLVLAAERAGLRLRDLAKDKLALCKFLSAYADPVFAESQLNAKSHSLSPAELL